MMAVQLHVDVSPLPRSRWRLLRELAGRLITHPRITLRKLISWQEHETAIGRLLPHAAKLTRWLACEDAVTAAVRTHEAANGGPSEFTAELNTFRGLMRQSGRPFAMDPDDILPCLDDRGAQTPFDPHYIYHPAWAARILARTRPERHVDISSILSFATVVSAFVPVDFYDFRPARLHLSGFTSGRADLSQLPFPDRSIPSLSCMHVIEHVGLGRYGDPLNPDGDLQAIRELVRVLGPGGNLLVVVPVGRPRIQFNAHRIYRFSAFREYFAGLELVESALIADQPDGLIINPPSTLTDKQNYGCGCYWFRKLGEAGAGLTA
jgi:SAM-dependent methyltransferase